MAFETDPIAIATEGVWCQSVTNHVALATAGYVCDAAGAPAALPAVWRMWTGGIGIDMYGRYDRG